MLWYNHLCLVSSWVTRIKLKELTRVNAYEMSVLLTVFVTVFQYVIFVTLSHSRYFVRPIWWRSLTRHHSPTDFSIDRWRQEELPSLTDHPHALHFPVTPNNESSVITWSRKSSTGWSQLLHYLRTIQWLFTHWHSLKGYVLSSFWDIQCFFDALVLYSHDLNFQGSYSWLIPVRTVIQSVRVRVFFFVTFLFYTSSSPNWFLNRSLKTKRASITHWPSTRTPLSNHVKQRVISDNMISKVSRWKVSIDFLSIDIHSKDTSWCLYVTSSLSLIFSLFAHVFLIFWNLTSDFLTVRTVILSVTVRVYFFLSSLTYLFVWHSISWNLFCIQSPSTTSLRIRLRYLFFVAYPELDPVKLLLSTSRTRVWHPISVNRSCWLASVNLQHVSRTVLLSCPPFPVLRTVR